MLIVLPIFTFVIVFLDLVGIQRSEKLRPCGWRLAILQTALLLNVFIVLQSELLSIFKALTQPWVALLWFLCMAISAWFGWRRGIFVIGWHSLVKSIKSLNRFEVIFSAALGVILVLIFVVAFLAPPNNTDSLLYHMARVVHMAENKSLGHYVTAFQPQLLNPIGAELVILNLRLLWGDDKLANLVQYFSMLISLVGVSALAGILGAGRKGQLVAVAFAASIPMGILQATSTQNDYVTALWLICLSVFVVLACKEEPGLVELLCIAAALGLGLLTKGTFYPYAVPLGIWLIAHWLRQRKPVLFIKRGALIVTVVLILNLGYWVRNFITYGGPLGSSQWVSGMTSSDRGIIPLTARLVENIALNFAPPDEPTTDWMLGAIRSAFQAVYPKINTFQLIWAWNHEDLAGNPLHMLMVPVSFLILLILARLGRVKDKSVLWYGLTVIASFVALSSVIHGDLYGVRYQLPFFVSWAPVFGFAVSKLGSRRLASMAAFLFLLAALPWVFFNTTRPLIAIKKKPEPYAIRPLPFMGVTRTSSVLAASPTTILFANWNYLQKPDVDLTKAIQASECKNIGLRIDSHDIEYEYWWLLGAPQNGIRIESIYYSSGLARYADPSFKPCAIICTICGDRTRLHGMDLAGTYPEVKLFLGGNYDPNYKN
jgi:hypothetical protein